MNNAQEGINVEDLVYYAEQTEKIGKKYKDPGDQHIMHLTAAMAMEAQAAFGEKGLEMVGRAVSRFCEARGRRITRIVAGEGKPLTLINFFLYYDLEMDDIELAPEIVNGELHVHISKCGPAEKLKQWGLEQFGIHYCLHSDEAILRGYNPKLSLEITKRLTSGDDCCRFIYRQPAKAIEG